MNTVLHWLKPYFFWFNIVFWDFHRTIGDRIGEGKASGNLGNTLKVLGRFDEAVVCCQRHLDISQEQGDKVTWKNSVNLCTSNPHFSLTFVNLSFCHFFFKCPGCRLERPGHCTILEMCSMQRANSSYGAVHRNQETCRLMSERRCRGPLGFMSMCCFCL